jgi:hypothetical protein
MKTLIKHKSIYSTTFLNTGGPCDSRSLYLRIQLFAVHKRTPNLKIRGLSLAYSRFFFNENMHKKGTKSDPFMPYSTSLLFAASLFAVV